MTSSRVQAVYRRLAPLYDVIYGVTLEHGRRRAMRRLAPTSGETILEIGVGTGLSALRYPRECRVVAVDVSEAMLARAQTRLHKHGAAHISLSRMDAAHLAFKDGTFDAVYCPYVINVVSDPVAVACELRRVCRPGGRLVLLNHFAVATSAPSLVDEVAGRLAARAGVNWQIDLQTFLRQAGLDAISIEPVNLPRVSSVVVCHR